MKFVYPFQKVLDVKTNQKKQAESLLSEAIGQMSEAERMLSELIQAKTRTQQQLVDDAARGRPMAGMIAGQRYIDHLDERIRAVTQSLESAERRVNELRDRLTERTVDEKVWIKSKDKARAVYLTESERRAQQELDELATARSRYAY